MEAFTYIQTKHKLSKARTCKLTGMSRGVLYYQKKMPAKDAALKEIISTVIGNRRIGREKVIALVQKKYTELSASKIRRVYQREGFSLTKHMKRKRHKQVANPIRETFSVNEEWGIDFMSDALESGKKFRTLNMIDHYNRACRGISISNSFPAWRLVEALDEAISFHGKPQRIRMDNGPEFRSKRFQLWLEENNIQWMPIENGKPQQNAIIERFNRTYREDILDAHIFSSIRHAQEITRHWLKEYNGVRPHESLGFLSPLEYAA